MLPLKHTPLLFPKMNSGREIVMTSPLLFLKKISSGIALTKNLPLHPKTTWDKGSDEDSPSISNNDQEHGSNNKDVSYESSKDIDQESNTEDSQ
uniref:Uncharacterized protein n=1 Tax=Cannabis sativa TaxID=3483 RepID=A0A803Q1K2_CANSA